MENSQNPPRTVRQGPGMPYSWVEEVSRNHQLLHPKSWFWALVIGDPRGRISDEFVDRAPCL